MPKKTGIYIHIPFCVKKCNYCAFLSFDAEGSPREEYTDALCKEIKLRAEAMKNGDVGKTSENKLSIDTVYIGGGTPSVLDVSQMRDIMHTVKTSFDIKPDAEITIEVNPGTLGVKDGVTKAKLAAYKSMGFNRLSMGVQSMDNDTLRFLGRIHTAENIARDVRLIREAGFDNLNLDLIFSIPFAGTQKNAEESERLDNSVCTEEKNAIKTDPSERAIDDARETHTHERALDDAKKKNTLERALADARKIVALEPEHISCYSLQIEEGTPFAEMTERGEITEIPDEEDRETYHAICKLLKDAGYEHYEISNFAKMPDGIKAPGFENCRDGHRHEKDETFSDYRSSHNSLYWDMSDYIGVGLGASGFVNGVRYKNVSDLDKYIETYSSYDIDHADAAVSKTVGVNEIKPTDASEDCAGCFEFPHEEEHVNTSFDNISEAVFTGVRRREGISYEDAIAVYERCSVIANEGMTHSSAKEKFWDIFGEVADEAGNFEEQGLLIIDDEGLRLTERGIDISNGIMALFV